MPMWLLTTSMLSVFSLIGSRLVCQATTPSLRL